MTVHSQTIATYDASAAQLADYFSGIGARTEDIERAIELVGQPDTLRAVEIGCGNGRDAKEIIKHVHFYRGFDPSIGMLKLAQAHVPDGVFAQADALTYDYPPELDIVYAFASLLHVSREDLPAAMRKIENALRSNGIFYISVKKREKYTEEVKMDSFGERLFFYYTPDLIRELAGSGFETVYEDHQMMGDTPWLTIALKKIT